MGLELEEYGRVCKEGKEVLLLEKVVERVSDIVVEEVGDCVMYWVEKWWQRRKDLLYWKIMDRFWSSPLTPLCTAGHCSRTTIIKFSILINLLML